MAKEEEEEETGYVGPVHIDLGRMLKAIADSGESKEAKKFDTSVMIFLACYAEENDEIIIDNFPKLRIPGTTSGKE